ncbi:hypothetical protein KI688_007193 [Linnemannia hyalina]|uniref:Uncharacterized protein n=1 Tax=Linnemannia hyalina TaxID=64524 RepID=A0A9P8BMZ9_9FUNG|nr:hypothetical protein KI688_007193 [Linnemannia hyalina]
MASADKQTFEKGAIVSADSASLIALAAEVAKHDEKFQRVKGVKGSIKVPRSVKKPTVWQRQNTGLSGRSKRHDTSTAFPDQLDEAQSARKAALERKAKMYEMLKRDGGEGIPDNLREELLVEFDDPRRGRSLGGTCGRVWAIETSTTIRDPTTSTFQELSRLSRNQDAIDKEEWIKDATGEMTRGAARRRPGYSQANKVRHYDNTAERRARGVGFYAFSQDEEERARQMRELLEMRNQTETSRSKHRTLKDKRREEIEARKVLIQQKRLKSLASTVAS